MYFINPAAFMGIIPVPAQIIKENLKTAGHLQLKVLLAVCLNPAEGFDCTSVAALTGGNPDEIEDCILFWQEKGVFAEAKDLQTQTTSTEEKPAVTKTEEAPAEKTTPQVTPVKDMQPERLTRNEIAVRLNESEDLRILLNEIQNKLGRTIGTNDQSAIINLHDFYGLGKEIILMICEFARTRNKHGNINYIYQMGKNWSKREIDTIESAITELDRLEKVGEIWKEFGAATNFAFGSSPTEKQTDTVEKWVNSWGFSYTVISLAFDEMKTNTGKLTIAYMDKVLANWHNNGIKTPEAVENAKKQFENKKDADKGMQKRPSSESSTDANEGASYDIQKAEQMANTSVPTVRKRRDKR